MLPKRQTVPTGRMIRHQRIPQMGQKHLMGYRKPVGFQTVMAGERTLALPGLPAPVRVVYDALGIHHVYGENREDVARAQGYITASRRLFQMHSLRMAGSGRLAELLGEGALAGDVLLRTLKLRATAELMAARAETEFPAEFAMIQAYAEGASEFIRRRNEGLIPKTELSTELLAFKDALAPWTPADTMTVVRLLTWQLGFGGAVDEEDMLSISTTIGTPMMVPR